MNLEEAIQHYEELFNDLKLERVTISRITGFLGTIEITLNQLTLTPEETMTISRFMLAFKGRLGLTEYKSYEQQQLVIRLYKVYDWAQ
jgi:hypothetical protein